MGKNQQQVFNGLAPKQGPKSLTDFLDFSGSGVINYDLQQETESGLIDYIQSVYVDNSANANALTFTFEGTQQSLKVPAGASGIWPVFSNGAGFRCKITTTQAAILIPVIWLNVPMPLTQWGPVTVNVAQVTATLTPVAAAFADFSGNTTAGASAVLFAANANAKRRIVQNPTGNAASIFINFGGVAASALTLEIPPGQKFDSDLTIDQSQWTIFAVPAQPYVAKEC